MAKISIIPPVSVYETFGRLNYKPWHAIAEFVDNSTQSFFENETAISESAGRPAQLNIVIEYDHDEHSPALRIRDNAGGMDAAELERALRLSVPPPDRSGRSEFGMGLKTAACWFGERWTITTTKLGEGVERFVEMDLRALAAGGTSEVTVHESRADPARHGTTVEIEPLRRRIFGRAINNIKKTLASMYRFDLRDGRISISWNGERLSYEEPELYRQPLPDGSFREWRRDLTVEVTDPTTGEAHKVRGWVGILKTMEKGRNGFALARRGRMILGGDEELWRPTKLLGGVGSHSWKRLVGELHLDSFPVNFSKDGFAWATGLEEALIEALEPEIAEYRRMAQDLRVRGGRKDPITPVLARQAVDDLGEAVRRRGTELERDLNQASHRPRPAADLAADPQRREALIAASQGPAELKIPHGSGTIVAKLYMKGEGPHGPWLELSFAQPDEVDVFLNTDHPYIVAISDSEHNIRRIIEIALALALAERLARGDLRGDGPPMIHPDDLRVYMNTCLRHWAPENQ